MLSIPCVRPGGRGGDLQEAGGEVRRVGTSTWSADVILDDLVEQSVLGPMALVAVSPRG